MQNSKNMYWVAKGIYWSRVLGVGSFMFGLGAISCGIWTPSPLNPPCPWQSAYVVPSVGSFISCVRTQQTIWRKQIYKI